MNAGISFNVLCVWVTAKFNQSLNILNEVAHCSEVKSSGPFVINKVNIYFVDSTEQKDCRYSVVALRSAVVNRLLTKRCLVNVYLKLNNQNLDYYMITSCGS